MIVCSRQHVSKKGRMYSRRALSVESHHSELCPSKVKRDREQVVAVSDFHVGNRIYIGLRVLTTHIPGRESPPCLSLRSLSDWSGLELPSYV